MKPQLNCDRVSKRRDNDLDLYEEGIRFETGPAHQICRVRIASWDSSRPISSKSLSIFHLVFLYITSAVERASLSNLRIFRYIRWKILKENQHFTNPPFCYNSHYGVPPPCNKILLQFHVFLDFHFLAGPRRLAVALHIHHFLSYPLYRFHGL
jgi:hypothetical protein